MLIDKIIGFFQKIKSYPRAFRILNIIQMLEILAYWSVLLQMSVYISQKDAVGGLHWGQSVKGAIFLVWALVQRLTPFFAGGFADRYGYKRTLFISFFIIVLGYVLLGTQKDFYPFLGGIIILGFGSGIFKPTLQGSLAKIIDPKKSSVSWGIYFMLLNLAVFFGSPVSKFLKSISWQTVFLGSAVIFSINFIILIFFKEIKIIKNSITESPKEIFKKTIKRFFEAKVVLFILIMSGFSIIYMQFYETLPNFIIDWIDTSVIVKKFGLPEFLTTVTSRGKMISFEWLYNFNAGLIIIGVVYISWLFGKIKRSYAIIAGIMAATLGSIIIGSSMSGYLAVGGIFIYTFGEMITNPKFTEHLGSIAPANEKALYMGFLNISWALGLGGGSILGGFIYERFGEKAGLALRYLAENYKISEGIKLTDAMERLQAVSGLNAADATALLWNTYHPYLLWLPFLGIGIAAAAGMWLYSRKY